MSTDNYREIATNLRNQLPFYMQQGDYENFVKFLELYYEWMAEPGNPVDVGAKLLDYTNIDETLDIFVDEFKTLLADSFPNSVKIKNKNQVNSELAALFGVSNIENERFETDDYIANGITSAFAMSYREPSFYEGKNVSIRVVELKVYANPTTGVYTEESDITRTTESADQIFASLSFPDDFVELQEGTDYIINEDRVIFYNPTNGQIVAPTDQVAIRILYRLKTTNSETTSTVTDTRKRRFSNKKQFLKFMKEFYLSKGSEKSYEFLFRTFFNEDISFYYPKLNVFKSSNNEWISDKSLRTIPSTGVLTNPVRLIGETSKATAVIERYDEFSVNNFPVREYFVSSIFGEFQDRENVIIENENGVMFKEELYTCVTGFNVINPGRNYPRNMYLNSFISDQGSGVGFSSRISDTTSGEIDKVNIIQGGDGYITGEYVEFDGEGTLGDGAVGKITAVDGTTENISITFVQSEVNDDYPTTYWDITDSGNEYSNSFSRNTKVTIVNRDNLWDNTKFLLDFETLQNPTQFKELKNGFDATRVNVSLNSPEVGPKFGNNSAIFTNGWVTSRQVVSSIYQDDELTFDFWYIPQSFSVTNGIGAALFAINSFDGTYNKLVLWQTDNNELVLTDSDTEAYTSSPLSISTNDWNHIAVYISTTGAKVYLNGVLAVETLSITTSGMNLESTDKLFIGVDTDAAFGDNPPPTRQEVFDTWTRISHDNTGVYPANSSDLTAFSYNSTEDRIECLANLGRLTGFISSEDYGKYTFSSTVTSTDGDDDTIGLLFGFYKDPDTGKEHTLTALRSQGGTLDGGGYQIWYNHLQSDGQLLFDGNSLVTEEPAGADGLHGGTGWSGIKARIKIVRDGNSFTIQTSQNSLSDLTDDDLDPATTITVNLGDYTFGDLFAETSPYGYVNHSQGAATWTNITFLPEDIASFGDYSNSIFDTFRITTGQRFNTYIDATNGNAESIFAWELDPIEKPYVAVDAENTVNSNAKYFWGIQNNRLYIMEEVFNPDGEALTWDSIAGNLSTQTGNVDSLTVRPDSYNRALVPIQIPDWYTVTLEYTNLPRGGVKRVDLLTGGFGYIVPPTAQVAETTGRYNSTGTAAVLRPQGDRIGGIKKIRITQSNLTNRDHGFGIGYITPPTLDLSGLGDGTAEVEVLTGPLCVRDGTFINDQGFLSDNNRIHDGYLWQDYSYVIQVGRVINEWRDIVKKIIHPAGLMMFGELTLLSKPDGKRLRAAYLSLLYEIIKNVDVTVKNMDGLGVWTDRNEERLLIDEGNDGRTSDGTWSNTDTFFMEQFGDLGPVHAHGPFTSENIDLSVQLPEHNQVRYQIAWHHVDSHDNEINKLQYKNKLGDFVDLAIWTKSLSQPNPTSLETFGDTTYTWFNNKTYSYAPWAGNPDIYENHGYAIIDTGWIDHDSEELVIRHVVGTDQDITDEASYLSHAKVYIKTSEQSQNSNDIMSHGYVIKYNNRQESLSDLVGVSDDTPFGQSFDNGSGRYALLKNDFSNATTWQEIDYVAVKWEDMDGKDYSYFYEGEVIERTFTIYNTSEQPITGEEWKSTRPWAKYKIISAVSDTVDRTVTFGVVLINSFNDLPNLSPENLVEFRWDKKTRGNVERVNSRWIGSIRDGANPRDEKFILRITSRDLPDSGTTYRSLERFKFFFSSIFPFEELVRYRFSPYSEAETSPLLDYYGFNGPFNNISMKGITYTILQNPDGTNSFGMVPTYGNNNFLGITQGDDHYWPEETIKNVMENYNKRYRAVLDSSVNLWPKLLVITEENKDTDGPRVSGMTWESVERMKFNQTPQSIDNFLYEETTEDVEKKYLQRTNITHETIMTKYSSAPTTFEELNQLQQI